MLDKLFRVHSEKNQMNGTASTKENGVRRALSDDRGRRRRRRSDRPGRFRSKRAHDEVEEFEKGFHSVPEARREEAAVAPRPAELLPAPGGRQPPAARPAAVHGQLQVYHLLSSESYLPPSLCSNVSYFIRQSTGQRRHGQSHGSLRQVHDVRQQHGDGHGPDAARHGRDGRGDLGRLGEVHVAN